MKVEEVTLDLSDSMRKIVSVAFPKIDRFHIQKLACDAVQEIRVAHRWDALQQANDEMEECNHADKPYAPFRFSNGDTRPELLVRSRYLLFKSADKWTEKQKERAKILFEEYPDIKMAYGLSFLRTKPRLSQARALLYRVSPKNSSTATSITYGWPGTRNRISLPSTASATG